MLGKKKDIKTFDDLELDNRPMPMAAECCLAEDVFVPTKKRSSLLYELEDIKAEYPDNWDGAGAKSISFEVEDNIRTIIQGLDYSILKGWNLILRTNGSVSIMADDKRASIEIGDKYLSYYVKKGSKLGYQHNIKIDETLCNRVEKIIQIWQLTKETI